MDRPVAIAGRAEYFPVLNPARGVVWAGEPRFGALIEIEAVVAAAE